MSAELSRVSIRILDKDYHVACPPDERADLLDSAELLDRKMREIREGGRVVGLDRIAVMAALNICNELLKVRQRGTTDVEDVAVRLKALRERVEASLEHGQQLEL